MSNNAAKTTPAAAWKKSSGTDAVPTPVPSGNVARIRIPGVEVFFKQGMIPNSLKAIIQEAISQGDTAPDMSQLMPNGEMDLEKLEEILTMTNAIVVYSVVEPQVLSNLWSSQDHLLGRCLEHEVGQEIPAHQRDEDALYVDQVDLEDRMFILQLAFGGTRDLESFRKGLAGDVAAVSPGKDVAKPTKRASRPPKR